MKKHTLLLTIIVAALVQVGHAQIAAPVRAVTTVVVTLTPEQLAALDPVLNVITPAVRERWVQAKVDEALSALVAKAREQRRAAIIDAMTADDDAVRATAVEIVKALKDKTWTCAQAEAALKRKLPCSGGGL